MPNFDKIKQQIKHFNLSVRDYVKDGNTVEAEKVKMKWTGYMEGLDDAGVDEEKLVDIIEEVRKEIRDKRGVLKDGN